MSKLHRTFSTQNLIGGGLCAIVGVFALTTAPTSLAQDTLDQPVTLRLQMLPFGDLVILIADFAAINILVSDQVYSGRVSLEAQDVPVGQLLEDLVECAGATLQRASEELLVISPSGNNEPSDQCDYITLDDSGEFGIA
jgi:type II secretory pathway component HofQ